MTGLPINTNQVGTHTIRYNVVDSSSHAANEVTRTVIVRDTTKPTITLSGSTPMTVVKGQSFNDPGAICSDNVSCTVTVSPTSINTNTIGTHTITYTAKDPTGNTATVTRTVNVVAGGTPVITLSGDAHITILQ